MRYARAPAGPGVRHLCGFGGVAVQLWPCVEWFQHLLKCLVSDAPDLAGVSICLATLRKQRAMSDHGRKVTARVVQQWQSGHMAKDVAAIALTAAKATARWSGEPTRHYAEAGRWLRDVLVTELAARAGRKSGLISSSGHTSTKMSGRPADMDLRQERSWLVYLYGVKARLYFKRGGFRLNDDFFKHLHANGGTQLLDAEVSDREVLTAATPHISLTNREINALRTRLRRARRAHSFSLPPRKSGG